MSYSIKIFSKRAILAVFIAICGGGLLGCAGPLDSQTDSSVQGNPTQQEEQQSQGVESESSDSTEAPEPQPQAEDTSPDSTVQISDFTCEPLDPRLIGPGNNGVGTPYQAVQVEVGEGNEPGSSWWIVVMDMPYSEQYWQFNWQDRRRSFLTNAPSLLPTDGSTSYDRTDELWIDLPQQNTWENVDWDESKLGRAQVALEAAYQFLGTPEN